MRAAAEYLPGVLVGILVANVAHQDGPLAAALVGVAITTVALALGTLALLFRDLHRSERAYHAQQPPRADAMAAADLAAARRAADTAEREHLWSDPLPGPLPTD